MFVLQTSHMPTVMHTGYVALEICLVPMIFVSYMLFAIESIKSYIEIPDVMPFISRLNCRLVLNKPS